VNPRRARGAHEVVDSATLPSVRKLVGRRSLILVTANVALGRDACLAALAHARRAQRSLAGMARGFAPHSAGEGRMISSAIAA